MTHTFTEFPLVCLITNIIITNFIKRNDVNMFTKTFFRCFFVFYTNGSSKTICVFPLETFNRSLLLGPESGPFLRKYQLLFSLIR